MALLDDFVAYVQRELFKRPFSNDDPAQESIMIRRGGGPPQLTGLELGDLEIVGQKDGEVVGIPIGDLAGLVAAASKRKRFTQKQHRQLLGQLNTLTRLAT